MPVGAASQGEARRHSLTTNVAPLLISHFNAAYDFRLNRRIAFGVDAMYSPRFLWLSPEYEESFWNSQRWYFGRARRVRLRTKVFPFGSGLAPDPKFYFSMQMVGRDVFNPGVILRRDRYEAGDFLGEQEKVAVSVRRRALLWDIGCGMDIPIEKVTLGWFLAWSQGIQVSEYESLHEASLEGWLEPDLRRAVFHPRAGFVVGYTWGRKLEGGNVGVSELYNTY